MRRRRKRIAKVYFLLNVLELICGYRLLNFSKKKLNRSKFLVMCVFVLVVSLNRILRTCIYWGVRDNVIVR